MSIVAIITARGGSKRIPCKNIKSFCGKPIIAYSIEAALKSELFDEVMVSTDDKEIADIAKQYGANVPFLRSADTANDFADTSDVLKEVLFEYNKLGKRFEFFCCLYPTAPFVTAQKLKNSFELFQNDNVYNVVPMAPFSFPPQRGMIREKDFVKPFSPQDIEKRSQDLQVILHDSGQFYWCKTKAFLDNPNILYNHTAPFIVSETEVQDIDNQSDWELAEIKYSYMVRKNGNN